MSYDLWGSITPPLALTWALRDPLVFVEKATEDWLARDPLLGEVGGRAVGPGRSELSAAVGSSSVVTGLILGQDQLQVSLSEDQHPVSDLGPVGCQNWATSLTWSFR
jgi:hypothetical protein